MTNNVDNVNRARLEQEKGVGSYDTLAEKLGVNVNYLFYYMVKGDKPTKNTKKGRDARKALGIIGQNEAYTKPRNEVLREYAKAKGYKSYSEIGTLILKGKDPIKYCSLNFSVFEFFQCSWCEMSDVGEDIYHKDDFGGLDDKKKPICKHCLREAIHLGGY